ncbi:MAG: ATP-binding protein [Anaerolineales bacterium]
MIRHWKPAAPRVQLLSRVSHELRTPLGGILGYAELLRDNIFGDLNEKQKKAAVEIIESANHLTAMVNELLDEAQIRANSTILQEKPFSPIQLVEQASAGLGILAQNKGLKFTTSVESGLPAELFGDERRLRQIIINLAGNAIKFTKDGEVCVKLLYPAEDAWAIQVTDTGVGISQELRAIIFEPFRQVNNSITRDNRGIGLGLSITKQLVELMNGRIMLESELGKGSIFTVILPIKKGNA